MLIVIVSWRYEPGMGPRAARAYARAAAAGTVSVMSVFKFTNLYSI